MILWFGKKKKKKELEEAGKAIEDEEARAAGAETGDAEGPVPAEPAPDQPPLPSDRPGVETESAASPDFGPASPESDQAPGPLPSDRPGLETESAADEAFDAEPPAPEPSGASETEAGPAPEPDPAPEPEPETQPEPDDPVAETKKPGFLSRLTSGLSRSSSRLAEGITGVFTRRKLDDETLEELEDLLIASDLGAGVAARVTANLAKDRFDKEVSDEEIKLALAEEIAGVLAPREQLVDFADGPRPRIVLFVGVNGSGKTTTIGKIASKLKAQGAKALLVAGDTFRAAAIEQLTVWGERAGIPVLSRDTGADAAGLVYEAVEKARAENLDLVLVDTAGRLQNKSELMAELAKIIRVTRKLDPTAPHDVILVLDATVGQNALSQVEAFRHSAQVSGLVMTKLDGTAKGGVLVAIADKHDLPIHFVGVGERAEDLHPFSADAFARALVGL
ncbi:MAG: signal recognition particle-docking protein FtsY [Alphaproteobacteria bacterium]|jgi:fused signal recognition particle receptor|nr:signal recognition particle-docking protein FtsY [Alphaproteobacteria bacterium]